MNFQVQLAIPGSASKMGTMHESFKSKTLGRSTKVPLVTWSPDTSKFPVTIGESPAILTFICEQSAKLQGRLSPFYAEPASARKITIDWYMHWHHTGLRPFMAKLVEPHLRSDLVHDTSTGVLKENLSRAHGALELLDRSWLPNPSNQDSLYIGGEAHPSIADLLAFEEVIQVTSTGLLLESPDPNANTTVDQMMKTRYPNVWHWMQGMMKLPFYDQVHVPIQILGNLSLFTSPSISNDEQTARQKQMQKILGSATKDGLRALVEAQSNKS
jgi:glutathione S-transferase